MTQTIQNLAKAFAGESQARNRYTMYAKIAMKEGYEQISAIFSETADQEAEHAKWLMKLINELKSGASEDLSELKIEAGVPTVVGDTKQNLQAAIGGEHHEYASMYPEFAATAESEGMPVIAAKLKAIAKAEAHHEDRYQKLLAVLENGSIFSKSTETSWVCRKCGYKHTGANAPLICPACEHPQAYYQLQCEEY
jgi:rubrerythrin